MSTDTYPLKWPPGWPRTGEYNRAAGYQFKNLTPEKAFRTLRDELVRLGASNVVISSNLKPRVYGGGYIEDQGNARTDPGIAVYFLYNGKQMSMAQDAYQKSYINARSLALAIEAMRAIERHGGGFMMQRSFDGFAQLPPPEGHSSAPRRPWREVLDVGSIDPLPKDAQLAIAEAFYKREARKSHPDSPGGNAQAMAELNVAIDAARQELA